MIRFRRGASNTQSAQAGADHTEGAAEDGRSPVTDVSPEERETSPAPVELPTGGSTGPSAVPATTRVTGRRFAALAGAAAALAGAHLISPPRTAEGAYYVGQGPDGGDLVDAPVLRVGQQLLVNGSVGIGIYPVPQLLTLSSTNNVIFGFYTGTTSRVVMAYQLTSAGVINNRFVLAADAGGYRLILDSQGNLGIGTEVPLAKLDVVGTIRSDGASAGVNVNGTTAIDGTATATKAYYAP